MDNNEYIFWIIPDLPERPQRYLICRTNDRRKPIAYAVFENGKYTVSGTIGMTNSEQLKILEACDKFCKQKFCPEWD